MSLFRLHSPILGAILVLTSIQTLHAQGLYDLNTLQKIEITFPQANWDYQMDTAKAGADGYLMASHVLVNGVDFDSVGIKYKGNSSYDSTYIKNPLHIALNEFKSQNYQGYTSIKLSNEYADPSMIREVLAYRILGHYMDCPLSNFAQVYINGTYWGLYTNDEFIDKNFCADHFYSSQNTLVKCNPTVNPGPTTKSNFKYINSDSSSYSLYYEIKSKHGWNELVALCDSVTNNTASLDHVLDMDRVIWMLAFNNLIINLDSYNGVFAQNHYTYKDNTGHFNPVIWDMNMAFGGFPFAGSGATSMGNLTIPTMQQLSTANHATDPNWPLINAVQADPTYKRKYIAHMRTILQEYFSGNTYKTLAGTLSAIVDTAVQSDGNKFFTYLQFQQGMDSLVDLGSYKVPGISMLMDNRVNYLTGTTDFTATPPTITLPVCNPASPVYNSTFTVTAQVSNANTVTLGYRYNKTLKFVKVPMYDDGLHGDGAANDQVYGAQLTMSDGQMQYYVYAENTNAGMFSPQRAEHEFYTVFAQNQVPTAGDLVINELLADNANNQKDEYNNSSDWIELYNNTSHVLDLSSIYLSNTLTNPLKWKFPAQTTLIPNGYLIVWADNDSMKQIFHANFNLNKDSGLLLLSNSTQLLDSISFFNQTTNISFGRYPNGTGSFIPMNTSFGYINNNDPLSVIQVEQPSHPVLLYYPNPSDATLYLTFEGVRDISITDLTGRVLYHKTHTTSFSVATADWHEGIYILHAGKQNAKLLIRHSN